MMIVERPREGDAIGVALRDAYARDQLLPDDLAGLLRQLSDEDDVRGDDEILGRFSRRG